MNDDRRRKRREIRLIQNESSWLQKALFALGKAEDARDKLADMRGEEPEPFELELDGDKLSVERFEEALEKRTQTLLSLIRARRRTLG